MTIQQFLSGYFSIIVTIILIYIIAFPYRMHKVVDDFLNTYASEETIKENPQENKTKEEFLKEVE